MYHVVHTLLFIILYIDCLLVYSNSTTVRHMTVTTGQVSQDTSVINTDSTFDTMTEQLVEQPNLHSYHRRRDSIDVVDYTHDISCDSMHDNTDCIAHTDIRQLDNAIVARAMSFNDGNAHHEQQPETVNFVLYDQPAYLWTNTDPVPYLSSRHVDGSMSCIFDWLYLGARSNAADYDELQQHQITHIYNTCTESPNFFHTEFQYINLPIDDKRSEADKLYDALPTITEQLHQHYIHNQQHTQNPHHVLVHCVAGVSRSPTIVAAYLIRYHDMSLVQSIHHILQSRDRIQPNDGFIDILGKIEALYRLNSKSTLTQTKRLLHRNNHT